MLYLKSIVDDPTHFQHEPHPMYEIGDHTSNMEASREQDYFDEEFITVPRDAVSEEDSETRSDTYEEDHSGREAFLDVITGLMDQDKVIAIRREQSQMMDTLETANCKLCGLNDYSEEMFQNCVANFRQHTKTLVDMKKQLDSIFRRIRHLKTKVSTLYPEAYATVMEKFAHDKSIDEDDD